MDFVKMMSEGAELDFAIEIVGRTVFMFLLILFILRLSGRRGVRQLTLFEVAIILGLGSAAGDPMFQEDIPILYGIIVLSSVIILYKFITFLSSRFLLFNRLMEGKEMIVVQEGKFSLEGNKKMDFSQREFFAELRNKGIEHLGQVRMGVLEIDGSLSVLFYDKEHIRYGLPLFPLDYVKVNTGDFTGPFACMYCGLVVENVNTDAPQCPYCGKEEWTKAINTPLVS